MQMYFYFSNYLLKRRMDLEGTEEIKNIRLQVSEFELKIF